MSGNIAVVGEREVAMGFRLIGIADTFIAEGRDAVNMILSMIDKKEYSVVIASWKVRESFESNELRRTEVSLSPLVVFIPSPDGEQSEESLEKFAKRVLGVDINSLRGA